LFLVILSLFLLQLLANLFKYNDLSQTLLSVFSDMNEGNLSLVEGQSVIQATLNDGSGNQSETKNQATASLLDFSPANSPKPVSSSSSLSSNKVPVATAVPASDDFDFFNAPPVATVSIQSTTNTNDFDPFGSSTQSKPSPVMHPSPVSKNPISQGSLQKLAPPPSSDKRVPFLAPPPAAGSIIGRSNAASFGIVTSGTPSVQSEQSPLTATSTPSLTPQQRQQQQSAAFDPFGNDSLLPITSSSSTPITAPPVITNVNQTLNPSPYPNYSAPSNGKFTPVFYDVLDISLLIGLNPSPAAPNAFPFSPQPGMGMYSPHPSQGMYPLVPPQGNYQNFAAFPPQGPGMVPPHYQPGMVPLPGHYYPAPQQGIMAQPMMPPNMPLKPAGAPVNNGNNSSATDNPNSSSTSESNPFDIFA
jgi:hypothetical protein